MCGPLSRKLRDISCNQQSICRKIGVFASSIKDPDSEAILCSTYHSLGQPKSSQLTVVEATHTSITPHHGSEHISLPRIENPFVLLSGPFGAGRPDVNFGTIDLPPAIQLDSGNNLISMWPGHIIGMYSTSGLVKQAVQIDIVDSSIRCLIIEDGTHGCWT